MKQIKAKMLACLLVVSGCFVGAGAAAMANQPTYAKTSITAKAETAVYTLGKLKLHANNGSAAGIYLQSPTIKTAELPVKSWDNADAFVLESGDGLMVNGEKKNLTTFKSTGDGLYFGFDALQVGDVITISGTFVSEKNNVKYIVDSLQFQWTGKGKDG